MSDGTKIEWTDSTWPIVAGCDKVSRGCKHCWAIRDSWRLAHNPNEKVRAAYAGTVHKVGSQLAWTGLTRELPDRLDWPLKWKKARRIFVCSQSDLFHEDVTEEFINQAFSVMAMCPQHTFQVLTKRARRAAEYLLEGGRGSEVLDIARNSERAYWSGAHKAPPRTWPLSNVHIGFSAEDQETFDERWAHMEKVAEAGWLVWLSAEPLTGEIRLGKYGGNCLTWLPHGKEDERENLISWVVAGGESGKGSEPTHPAWIRLLRDQCAGAGVPFLFKQWGDYLPGEMADGQTTLVWQDGRREFWGDHQDIKYGNSWLPNPGGPLALAFRVGKKKAGRLLDGREHSEFPK